MSAKHTPGPWKIERGHGTIIKSIGPCVPDEYAGSAWLEVSEEDARLIAAAPVLLDQLRFAVALLKPIFGNTPQVESMESAIAKAIG